MSWLSGRATRESAPRSGTGRQKIISLKLTILPLKTDGWKTTFLLGWRILREKLLVSGSATVLNVWYERLLFVLFAGVLVSYPKVLRMETGIFTYTNLLHQLLSHSCRWNILVPWSIPGNSLCCFGMVKWPSYLQWTKIKLCHGLNRLDFFIHQNPT